MTLFEALQRGGRGEGDGGGGRGGLTAIGTQRFALVASHGQERVKTEGGVVVEVVVAQGFGNESLGQEFMHGVVAITLVALIGKGFGELGGEAEAGIDLAEQQRATVAGEVAAGEIGQDLAAAQVSKEERLSRTDSLARGGSAGWHKA